MNLSKYLWDHRWPSSLFPPQSLSKFSSKIFESHPWSKLAPEQTIGHQELPFGTNFLSIVVWQGVGPSMPCIGTCVPYLSIPLSYLTWSWAAPTQDLPALLPLPPCSPSLP
jgi:hypothetical protein